MSLPFPTSVPDVATAAVPAALEWLAARRSGLLAEITRAGAVRLVGTPVRDAEAFEVALTALGVVPLPYTEGQSPRERVRGRIYTSTRYPPGERVPLHQELSYRAHPPDLLAFLCVTAPVTGGQTPILDGERFLDTLPRELLAPFSGRSVLYRKTMHGGFGLGKSWQAHFETDDRALVEATLSGDGATWEWLPDGALRVEQVRAAVAAHPRTGRPSWHNQVTLWHPTNFGDRGATMRRMLGDRLPTDARWEDGSPIDDALVNAVRAAEHAAAARFDWQPGDLLLLDNHRVLHGREPYEGDRLVLVAMGAWPSP